MSILLAAFAALGSSSGSDVTPDAVNWPNISGVSPQSTGNQTITGIDATITLSAQVTTVVQAGGIFSIFVNDSFVATFSTTLAEFSVSSGDTVSFSVQPSFGTVEGTVTVRNVTDSNTTLDTFTYNVSDS